MKYLVQYRFPLIVLPRAWTNFFYFIYLIYFLFLFFAFLGAFCLSVTDLSHQILALQYQLLYLQSQMKAFQLTLA